MPLYDVTLTRAYLVKINAPNADTAKRVSELYLGDLPDLSLDDLLFKGTKNFNIQELEMVINDASEVNEK